MEIEQSSLYREVLAVINNGANPVHYTWRADIHVNGEVYPALKVLSIDFSQDYENKYADEIILTVALLGGTYSKRIYPFKDKVDITLYRLPLQEVGDTADTNQKAQSERYTATLIDKGNPLLEANGMNAPSEDSLNLTNIFDVEFQLVNKSLEQMRMMSVGGIYRNSTVEDVVKGILTNESKKVKVEGGRLLKGVDMFEASNKAKRDHIIIPQGTKLVHVPQYVHEKCGGIYSAGMGYYLQSDYWYVYPCYDVTRFTKATTTLTIINIPKNKFPGIERTYRENGSNLVVLATGQVKFNDDSEVQQLNVGNGVRFAKAETFMTNFAKVEGNKAVANRGLNNSEFISTQRANGNNNVQLSSKPINANSFAEYSKLARRQGSIVNMVWENSLPALIFPGMMVKMLYLDSGEIKELYGVTLKAHHYVHTRSPGLTSARHLCSTVLSIFVQRLKD